MIMADDDSAMRVAKNDLSPHIYQLINKEETAFKHLLMNQHTSLALSSHHKEKG